MAQAETWHKSAESLLAQVETSRVRLKYLGRGFLVLVFMIGTLAGLARIDAVLWDSSKFKPKRLENQRGFSPFSARIDPL